MLSEKNLMYISIACIMSACVILVYKSMYMRPEGAEVQKTVAAPAVAAPAVAAPAEKSEAIVKMEQPVSAKHAVKEALVKSFRSFDAKKN